MSFSFGFNPGPSFGGFRPLVRTPGTEHVKYSPVKDGEHIMTNGGSQYINISYHCITCMREYEENSLEELRLEDYDAGRNTEKKCLKHLIYRRPRELVTWGIDGKREEINTFDIVLKEDMFFKCAAIRIGSYKYTPKQLVYVTWKGIKIVAPSLKDSTDVSLHIQRNEILKIFLNYDKTHPLIFLYTTIDCGTYIRKSLDMIKEKDVYYDPMSKNESHKRITMLLEPGFPSLQFQHMFSNVIDVISYLEAADIYVRAHSEDITELYRLKPFKGTAVTYKPVCGSEVIVKAGSAFNIETKHQCITVMQIYEEKSLEELRLEDYEVGRKQPIKNTCIFGFPQETKPVFWGTGLPLCFGTPTSTPSPNFSFKPEGYTPSITTSPFATKTNFGFGSAENNTGFSKPGTSVFGAPASTETPVFNANTSSFNFGFNLQNQNSDQKLAKPIFGGPLDLSIKSNISCNTPSFGWLPVSTPSCNSSPTAFGAQSLFSSPSVTTQSGNSNTTSTLFDAKLSFGSAPVSTQSGDSGTTAFGAQSLFNPSLVTTQSGNSGTTSTLFGAKLSFGAPPVSTQSGNSGTTAIGAQSLFSSPSVTTQSGNSGTTSTLFGGKLSFGSPPVSTQSGNSKTDTSVNTAKPLFGFNPGSTLFGNSDTTFAAKPLFLPPSVSTETVATPRLFAEKPLFSSPLDSTHSSNPGTTTSVTTSISATAPAKTESGSFGYTPSLSDKKPPGSQFLFTTPISVPTSVSVSAPVSTNSGRCDKLPFSSDTKPTLPASFSFSRPIPVTSSLFALPPVSKSVTTSIFASPPVSKSGTTSIFASPPVSKSGTTSIFASAPVSKSDTTSVFASAPVSKRDTTSIFASDPVSKTDTTSIFASAPVSKSDTTSIFASAPVSKSGTTSIFASASISQSDTTSIFASAPVSKSGTTSIFASPPVSISHTTSIFASAPVSKSDTTSIFASAPVSKSGTTSIFAPAPVNKSDSTSIFASAPVSKSDTTSIFASAPVSKSDTTSIFASAPVSKSDTTSIFASAPVSKSGTTSIFAPTPVNKSDSTSIFASAPVSKSDTTSIFASAPVSKSDTTSIFASAPVSKSGTTSIFASASISQSDTTSIFASAPVSKSGTTSIFASPLVSISHTTSIFASAPVSKSETTSIFASATISKSDITSISTTLAVNTVSGNPDNSALSKTTSTMLARNSTSDAPTVEQSDLYNSLNKVSLEGKAEEITISRAKLLENVPANIEFTDLIVHNPVA